VFTHKISKLSALFTLLATTFYEKAGRNTNYIQYKDGEEIWALIEIDNGAKVREKQWSRNKKLKAKKLKDKFEKHQGNVSGK
jgi:hypothetical protein